MGDTIEGLRAMKEFNREERQARHAAWYADNMAALRASGLRFEERPSSVLFREPGKPRVDFFLHTGRWRVVGGKEPARSGGAAAFLAWYRNRKATETP